MHVPSFVSEEEMAALKSEVIGSKQKQVVNGIVRRDFNSDPYVTQKIAF